MKTRELLNKIENENLSEDEKQELLAEAQSIREKEFKDHVAGAQETIRDLQKGIKEMVRDFKMFLKKGNERQVKVIAADAKKLRTKLWNLDQSWFYGE